MNSLTCQYNNIIVVLYMLFNCKKFFIDLKNCCKTRDTDLKFFNYFNHLCDSFFNNTNIVNVKPFLNLDKQLDNFSTINILLNELHKMYKQKVDIDINTNIEKENILYKAYDFWKSSHINDYSLVKNLFYGVVYKTVKCETCLMKESFENFFYITINDFDITRDDFCTECNCITKQHIIKKIIVSPKYIILKSNELNFNLSNTLFYQNENYKISSILYSDYTICYIDNKWIKCYNSNMEYINNIPRNGCNIIIYDKTI